MGFGSQGARSAPCMDALSGGTVKSAGQGYGEISRTHSPVIRDQGAAKSVVRPLSTQKAAHRGAGPTGRNRLSILYCLDSQNPRSQQHDGDIE